MLKKLQVLRTCENFPKSENQTWNFNKPEGEGVRKIQFVM